MSIERLHHAPVVSVVLPVRDGEQWMRSCLESLASQTFQDFEILLIDDFSSDDSINIALGIGLPNLRVVQGPGKGLAAALARGVEEAQGIFIARLDQDDIAEPVRFARQLQAFKEDPELVIVGSAAIEIDDHDAILGCIRMPETDRKIRTFSVLYNPFIHSSVMVRKQIVVEAGNYWAPDRRPYPEDFDLWVRVLDRGKGRNIDEPLIRYRRSRKSIMSRSGDLISMRTAELCVRNALVKLDRKRVPARSAYLLGLFHWRSRRIRPFEALKLEMMLLAIGRSCGGVHALRGFHIFTFLKPVGWLFR